MKELWVVDCGPCGGRRRAQTSPESRREWAEPTPGRLEYVTVRVDAPVMVKNTYGTPTLNAYCGECAAPASEPYRVTIENDPSRPPHPCGDYCLRAAGTHCNCVCLGACHGRGECRGHDAPAEAAP